MTTILDFANTHLAVTSTNRSELAFKCPFHDDHNASASININTGAWFCFGCHAKGGIKRLARKLGVRWSTNGIDNMTQLWDKLDQLDGRGKSAQHMVVLPESAIDRYNFPTDYWTEDRDLDPDIVERFELGYDPINDIAVIPVRSMDGDLLGFVRRFLEPDADPKYKETKGFKKSHHLFAAWVVKHHSTAAVALMEGPVDAMKSWQAGVPAVAQYGSFLSEEQIRVLRQLGLTTIVMFYDNDEGGRKAQSWALGFESHNGGKRYNPAHDLRKFFLVKKVLYPRSVKDPDMLTTEELRQTFASAEYVL